MDLDRAVKIIGIDLKKEFKGCKSMQEAKKRLPKVRDNIRKLYWSKAKELHPDINDIDDMQMKELNEAYNLLKKLKILPPKSSPPVVFVYKYYSPYTTYYSTTSTGATSTAGGWF